MAARFPIKHSIGLIARNCDHCHTLKTGGYLTNCYN
ncbi:hypothetical protein VPHD249_0205 [Vibrio phage D249]